MDIYIRTEDVRLGRALALEAQAAGFSAGFGQDAADARLTVCDLDFKATEKLDSKGHKLLINWGVGAEVTE